MIAGHALECSDPQRTVVRARGGLHTRSPGRAGLDVRSRLDGDRSRGDGSVDRAVNGTLTVSENIADVAGLSAAYDAYRTAFSGREAPTVQGITGDQQFFLSFAQSWRRKIREPAARRQILTNGHAPAEYRGDTVRNLDAWYTAFGSSRTRRCTSHRQIAFTYGEPRDFRRRCNRQLPPARHK